MLVWICNINLFDLPSLIRFFQSLPFAISYFLSLPSSPPSTASSFMLLFTSAFLCLSLYYSSTSRSLLLKQCSPAILSGSGNCCCTSALPPATRFSTHGFTSCSGGQSLRESTPALTGPGAQS